MLIDWNGGGGGGGCLGDILVKKERSQEDDNGEFNKRSCMMKTHIATSSGCMG
ncbi:hypothetical protein HanRHA438_Chr03g0105311 [Helianthus annuus]|nr:hypothetical protein HanRHA438_Chr03g0105311 [Helianthus annuus]